MKECPSSKGETIVEIHSIKHKNGDGACIWNVKGEVEILFKKIDMQLRNIPNMVIACLCLDNLCLIHADEFDMNWVRSAEEKLKKTSLQNFGDFRDVNLFHVLESGISEVMNIQI